MQWLSHWLCSAFIATSLTSGCVHSYAYCYATPQAQFVYVEQQNRYRVSDLSIDAHPEHGCSAFVEAKEESFNFRATLIAWAYGLAQLVGAIWP